MKLNIITPCAMIGLVIALPTSTIAVETNYTRTLPAGCTYVRGDDTREVYMLMECSRSGERRITPSNVQKIAPGIVQLSFSPEFSPYSGFWCSSFVKRLANSTGPAVCSADGGKEDIASSEYRAEASPINIVVPKTGCGSGCFIQQKQIGQPYQDKKGLRKVLIEQTFTMSNGGLGGREGTEIHRKYFLAECNRRKANFTSYSSNGSGEDDVFRWVDVPYGPKESRQAGPNWATYVQFDRLCALEL
jgi:hypothetical protein